MSLRKFLQCVAGLALALSLSATAWAGEKVPLDKLPEPVTKAVKERFPKGELLKAEKETEDGKVKYEVKLSDGGKKYEVDVSPDGTILEVEEDDD